MRSKVERVQNSMENIEGAICYYLYDAKRQLDLGKLTKSEHFRLSKNLSDMANILTNLKFVNPFSYKKLTEIRRINLSINPSYLEGDYDIIFAEIVRSNNELCKVAKERDKKMLAGFKKAYDHLPNFYKYRLSKAEVDDEDHMRFRDKGLDNVEFFLSYYLNVRYNFKRINFEPAIASEEYQRQIDDCTRVIENEHYSDEVKMIYSNIRRLASSVAKAEIVIKGLNAIMELCDSQEYLNIKVRAKILLNKYEDLYVEYKEKYDIVMGHLETKTAEIIAVAQQKDECQLEPSDNFKTM